jgi:UDP-N-acetyl-D-glucosamine dehydrogenase
VPGKVVVVGQGYVGLPLAMQAVAAGFIVIGYDIDAARVKRLTAHESYIEDVPSAVLGAAFDSGRFSAASEARVCAGFDIAVITVPTPLRDGAPDLSYIEDAARTLARYLRPGATIILESTTYPGTTEELVGPILEQGSGLVVGEDFSLGYSPERIDPGNEAWTIKSTPKVVSGVGASSLAAVKDFYDHLVDETVPVSGTREAELTKLLENTFRHVNVALVNELAMFAHDLNINIWEAVEAAASKPFGFMRFTPGPGVGGHCLPIDPSYLSWRVRRTLGHSFRFIELANDVNDHMPDYVVTRVIQRLNSVGRAVNGSRIVLLGLAYKRNSGDARESPSLQIAQRLLGMGAEVRAADPHVVESHVGSRIVRVDATIEELRAADAVLVLTDHDAFDLAEVAAHAAIVLDTRHCVPASPGVEYL